MDLNLDLMGVRTLRSAFEKILAGDNAISIDNLEISDSAGLRFCVLNICLANQETLKISRTQATFQLDRKSIEYGADLLEEAEKSGWLYPEFTEIMFHKKKGWYFYLIYPPN